MISMKAMAVGACLIAGLAATGVRVETSLAAQAPGTDQDTKQKDKKLAAGEAEAKRLLLLMDRDKSGKVSKEEFMKFMEEEFERLDKNKDGELDVSELTHFTPHTGVRR